MAAIILSQVATSLLAPSIYGLIGAGASVAASGTLWSLSQGIAGFAGSMLGSAIDRALFGGGPNVQGPRLNDLAVQSSADGAALPKVYGTFRLAGNVIWSTGLIETASEEDVGGGSGGGGGSYTTYAYHTDVAVAICEGEIAGIRRIWADTKLIYDIGESASVATLVASSDQAASIRVYPGTETQDPDPLIQADVDAASAPAYRGTAYVVFEGLQLADFGNRLPNFQFEVVKSGGGGFRKCAKLTDARQSYYSFAQGVAWSFRNDTGSVGSEPVCSVWLTPVTDSPEKIAGYVIENDPEVRWVRANTPAIYSDNPKFGVRYIEDPNYNNTYLVRCVSGDHVDKFDGLSMDSTRAMLLRNLLLWVECSGTDVIFKRLSPSTLAEWSATTKTSAIADPESFTLEIQEVTAAGKTIDKVQFISNHLDEVFVCASVSSSTGNVLCKIVDWDAATPTLETLVWQTVLADNLVVPLNGKYLLPASGLVAAQWLEADGSAGETLTDLTPSVQHIEVDETEVTCAHVCGDHLVMYWTETDMQYVIYGTLSTGTTPLDEVVADLLESAGLTSAQYDVTALASDTVRGYTVSRPMAMRAAVEGLAAAYHFDLVEEDGQIVAVKRGGALAATLDEDALGAAEQPVSGRVGVTRHNPVELPSEILLTYVDPDADYQTGTQTARRLTAAHTHQQQITLPLVMTSEEAARVADILLNQAWWSGREEYRLATTFDHLRLSPADRVQIPVYGETAAARVAEITLGAPGLVQIQAVPDLAALYTSEAVGGDALSLAAALGLAGPTKLLLLDCCMLRDQDTAPGLYVAMGGYMTGWPGANLYRSTDGGATWGTAASTPSGSAATLGYATTALGDHGCTTWDRVNTLTVRLYAGATLSSATELAVLNGANSALLGAPGRWELIQWQTATQNGDGSYTLSVLLRGRKGTDHAAASHAVYDDFVLLTPSGLQDLALTASEIDATRHYKAATAGTALESIEPEVYSYQGERLECLSPVDVRASRDGSGNITLSWKRRDRINAGWNNYSDVPMSEASEAYEVEIYTASTYATVKRTLTGLTSSSASYSSADQTTDFGGTQSTIYVRVYQLSAAVGRGHYREAAV